MYLNAQRSKKGHLTRRQFQMQRQMISKPTPTTCALTTASLLK